MPPRCFRLIAPIALLTAAALTGCTADRHTITSTQTAPKSVDVTYVRSGETAWTYDIPPGQKLTLEFSREGQFNGFKVPNTPAEEMKWYISGGSAGNDLSGHPGKFGARDSGQVELTGEPIQLNIRLRDPKAPDDTPAPIEVVPPPMIDEPAEPAQPSMDLDPSVDDTDPSLLESVEDTADQAGGLVQDAADSTGEVIEDAAEAVEDAVSPDVTK